MDLDSLLGKRFDWHLVDGQVLDVRVNAVDQTGWQATCHLLRPWQRRNVQRVFVADLLRGINEGVLVESCRP